MRVIMFTSLWLLSVVAVLAVDTRTENKDIGVDRCYYYDGSTTATCKRLAALACPDDRPYCATVASYPNFTSSLTCAAATEKTCSISYFGNRTFMMMMTCVCTDHLCNAPFSREFRNELIDFSLSNPENDIEFETMFWRHSRFSNSSKADLYKKITIEMKNVSLSPLKKSLLITPSFLATTMKTRIEDLEKLDGPKAEALKQEATVPSEDDEDEGEGSGTGADEESRSRHPSSAPGPAAPSSYLPAHVDENRADTLYMNFFATTPLLLYAIANF